MWKKLDTAEIGSHLKPPMYWRRRHAVAAWTVICLVMTGLPRIGNMISGIRVGGFEVLAEFLGWFLWIFFFPIILMVTRRLPFRRRHWKRWLAANLALGALISTVYGFVTLLVKNLVVEAGFRLAGSPLGLGALFDLEQHLSGVFFSIQFSLLAYFSILSVVHATRYFEEMRERQLRTSRLETQLAQSQLKLLKMQLRPHFLFNTLNAISALMHRDVDAADRMIALLSDLLRASLEKDERHQVTLGSELELLQRYLAIEEIRFRDRLDIRVDVAGNCMTAQVPKLILQPLVENSIRHGIAMRSAAGVIAIQARRDGDELSIQVSDDGPGLPMGDKSPREGVGLANTRARLEQLYGKEHHFELRNGRFGGFEVAMRIPFEEEARFPLEGAA